MNKKRLAGPFYRPLKRLATKAAITREYRLDRRTFGRHGGQTELELPDKLVGAHLDAQLTKDYHRVEKGLALQTPRRPFGAEVLSRLQRYTPAEPRSASETFAAQAAAALEAWNAGGSSREPLAAAHMRDDLQHDRAPDDFEQFFASRRSVRDFDAAQIPTHEVLLRATEWALNTPSVCNRQTGRVHFVFGEKAQNALRLQNGNAGFRESIPCVAVVTSDLRYFAGAGERNQCWVDGGLFAMTLVWAMHAQGLATCMLNWSMPNAASVELRNELGIPEHEAVITLVAIGYPRPGLFVARSPRRDVGGIARFLRGVSED